MHRYDDEADSLTEELGESLGKVRAVQTKKRRTRGGSSQRTKVRPDKKAANSWGEFAAGSAGVRGVGREEREPRRRLVILLIAGID